MISIDQLLNLAKEFKVDKLVEMGFYSISYSRVRSCTVQGDFSNVDIDITNFKQRVSGKYIFFEKTFSDEDFFINIVIVSN